MSEQNVTVTTDGRDIDATVESLREAGMTVTDVHREIGVISGSVAPADRDSLDGVPGVAAVESDRSFEIAPPDSDVQ
jgi:copper chaperone CopZ